MTMEESAALLHSSPDENPVELGIEDSEREWYVEDIGQVDIPSSEDDDELDYDAGEDDDWKVKFSWRKLWAYIGPGWLMCIAYLDPGNLEADLQAGATAGYNLIWILFWSHIIGYIFQQLAANLGTVTGMNLAQISKREYPRWASLVLWAMTELAIIGSDIQEVIGSAIALYILFGLPLWIGVIITACDTFTFLFLNYFGIRKLEALFGALVSTMGVCFAIMFAIGKPPVLSILEGWAIPRVPKSALTQAVGTIGAVIMPHNIFLHSALVQSRKIDRSKPRRIKEANYYFAVESAMSLFASFFINLCVVSVFASGFYMNSYSTDEIGLFEAGQLLKARFGRAAEIVWAIGLLAAGQSSTMTGTFAGQFVMQGFLELNLSPWVRTLITRSFAIIPTVIVAVSFTSKLDTLDQFLNVLQSIQLPFALLPLLAFSSSYALLGQFSLRRRWKFVFGFGVLCIIAINVFLVTQFILDFAESFSWIGYTLVGVFGLAYLSFIAYLIYFSFFKQHHKISSLKSDGYLPIEEPSTPKHLST